MVSKRKREVTFLAALGLMAVVATACGNNGSSASSTDTAKPGGNASQAASAPTRIYTCCLFSGTEIPTKVAVTQHLFKKYGLSTTELKSLKVPAGVQALVAGSVDIGPSAPSVVLNAYTSGNKNLVIVAGKTSKPVYRLMSKSITSAKDIKGKSVAVSGKYAPPAEAVYSYLDSKFDYEPGKDYKVVTFSSITDILPAVANGSVDVGVLSTPLYLSAKDKGAHIVADLSKAELEANAYIATTREYLKNHRPAVVKFVKAMTDAMHLAKSKPTVAKQAIKKYDDSLSAREVNATYEDYKDLFNPNIIPASIKLYQKFTNNPKVRSVKLSSVIDYSVLQDLASDGFLKKMGFNYTGPRK
jgi:ABC-type nitrate/sulfonate/bicarbonate transport system substrate-binding protein